LNLGINISRISPIGFNNYASSTRRLLDIGIYFSIISDSKVEATSVESVMDIMWMNNMLAISSENTIIAMSFVSKQNIYTPLIEITPIPIPDLDSVNNTQSLQNAARMDYARITAIALISVVGLVVLVILIRSCTTKESNETQQKRNLDLKETGVNITSGYLKYNHDDTCLYCKQGF